MDAFDADVLIYAATPGHPLGRRVLALFPEESNNAVGVGSLLLLPEVLRKPRRTGARGELLTLGALLGRIELLPVDRMAADFALAFCVKYGLKTVDAVHLATAVGAGADRFVTNNRRDFPRTISEIDVTYPDDLVDPV